MNCSELRHTLYAAFSEEADKIIDIQFMSRGCYHVEFASEEAVTKLLAIKEAGVEGAWISFHKWSHITGSGVQYGVYGGIRWIKEGM